jgi:hypothetical protein
MHEFLALPLAFCWTRFGTEAGETVETILERKERERRENGGVFFWGIGNSVGPAIAELVSRTASPEVLFSPIRSQPRTVDVHPPALTRWHGAITVAGDRIMLPSAVRILSSRSHTQRYALVCASEHPLRPADCGRLDFGALRNLVSGNRVGASQVTAVVERLPNRTEGPEYAVALRAQLVPPYFVRLTHPEAEPLPAAPGYTQAA